MSILYEALKKAEREQGVKVPVQERDHTSFIDAMARMENAQQKAIQECVRIESPRFNARQRARVIAASIAGALVVSAAVFFLWLRAGDQERAMESVLLATAPAAQSASAVVTQPNVVSFRDANAQAAKRPAREVSVSAAPVAKNMFEKTRDRFLGQTEFVCSGIVLDRSGDYCVMNDLVLRVGDMFNNALVIAINDYSVDLKVNGKTVTVPLVRRGR